MNGIGGRFTCPYHGERMIKITYVSLKNTKKNGLGTRVYNL